MHETLKIKIASLTAEARIIRNYEKRVKADARRHSDWLSGAVEAKAEVEINALTGKRSTINELREHRVHVVRNESRYAYLTLAFLRGKPYHRIERQGSKGVKLEKLAGMINRFGAANVSEKSVRDWLMSRSDEELAVAAE